MKKAIIALVAVFALGAIFTTAYALDGKLAERAASASLANNQMVASADSSSSTESSSDSASTDTSSSDESSSNTSSSAASSSDASSSSSSSSAASSSKSTESSKGSGLVGFVKKNGNTYYFNAKHQMVIGWKKIKGSKYYFQSDGAMATGMIDINGKKYCFLQSGKMVTGFKKIDTSKYYFNKNGVMAIGLTTIDGNRYFFADNGKMVTGWKKIKGNKFYLRNNGKMLVNAQKMIDDKLCTFNAKGVMVRSVDKNKPMVALTYDDGPSANTNTILDTLKKYGSVATFFVVGNRVSSFASNVKKANSMGCEIGNHTYSHKILTGISTSTIRSQLNRTSRVVRKVTGRGTVVMRPPGGSHDSTVRKTVKAPLILWSIDTLDWKTRKSSSTINAVLKHVKDGDIVLMHDLYAQTATASKTIIPKLVKRGYQLVTISELAKCRGGMKKGKAYYSMRG